MRGTASAASRRRWFVPGGRCGEFARRRADAKLVSALDASVRTSNRSLREVERLKRQRLVLARYVANFRSQAETGARIIAALERDGNTGVEVTRDLRRTIQSREEEIGYLRADVGELTARLLSYSASAGKDHASLMEDAWNLSKSLQDANKDRERLHLQRHILAIHLRSSMKATRTWERVAKELSSKLRSTGIMYPFQPAVIAVSWPFKAAWKLLQRLFLALLVGWKDSAEFQEAIDG